MTTNNTNTNTNVNKNENIKLWDPLIKIIIDKPEDAQDIINLYEKYMQLKDHVSDDNNYPIRKASELGCIQIVQYLLSNGADPTVDHNICLRSAVYNGHEQVVKVLLHDDRVDVSDNRSVDYCPSIGSMSSIEISKITLPSMTEYLEKSVKTRIITFEEFCKLDSSELSQGNTPVEINKSIVLNNAKYLTTECNKYANHMLYYLAYNELTQDELIQVFKSSVENDSINCIFYLINDFDIDPSFENNWAFRHAALYGNVSIVESLLCNNRVDPTTNNNEALSWAAQHGHIKVVELLLNDNRIDPNKTLCNYTNKPLADIANDQGYNDIAKLLANYGLMSNMDDEEVKKLLSSLSLDKFMSDKQNERVINKLLAKGFLDTYINDVFYYACKYGYYDLVKKFYLDNRVDVQANDNDAISQAMYNNHYNIVKLLLPVCKERLYCATCEFLYNCSKNNYKMAKLLFDNFELHYQDVIEMRLVVIIVFKEKYYDVLKLMMKMNGFGSIIYDLLDWLCESKEFNMIKYIIDNYIVDVTYDNNKLLMTACNYKQSELVRKLLAYTEVDPSDNNNYAIRVSSANNDFETVRLLLQDYRVNPLDNRFVDNQNFCTTSALQFAESKGFTEISKLIRRKRDLADEPTLKMLYDRIKDLEEKLAKTQEITVSNKNTKNLETQTYTSIFKSKSE